MKSLMSCSTCSGENGLESKDTSLLLRTNRVRYMNDYVQCYHYENREFSQWRHADNLWKEQVPVLRQVLHTLSSQKKICTWGWHVSDTFQLVLGELYVSPIRRYSDWYSSSFCSIAHIETTCRSEHDFNQRQVLNAVELESIILNTTKTRLESTKHLS